MNPEVHTGELRLAWVFFVLSQPFSLPDGYQVVMGTGDQASPELLTDDPEVSLVRCPGP